MEKKNYLFRVRNGKDENGYLNYITEGIIDGEIVVSYEDDCINNCLIDIYDREREFYDKYGIDTRYDDFKVEMDVRV